MLCLVQHPAKTPGHDGAGRPQQPACRAVCQVRAGMTTRNAVGAMPAAEDTPLAISAATRLGASAGAKLPPTCATVTAKSAEAIGVPNSAENSAAMPHTAAHPPPGGRRFSQLPNGPADAAAHLQGSALPSGRAAAQVGQHSAQKDGGCQGQRQGLALLHRAQYVVGAKALAPQHLIQRCDPKPGNGQQP